MRISSGIVLALALLWSLVTYDPDWVPWIVSLQFTLGTFLAAASAASSTVLGRANSGLGPVKIPEIPAGRIIWLKWLGAVRVVVPSLFLACVICLIQMIRLQPPSGFWREMPVMIAYMLSAGAAAASLGVTIWVWSPPRGWPVTVALVAWGLVNAGFVTVAAAVPGESMAGGLSMSSPVSGVWMLVRAITRRSYGPFSHLSWATVWTAGFSIAAVGLLNLACAAASVPMDRSSWGETGQELR